MSLRHMETQVARKTRNHYPAFVLAKAKAYYTVKGLGPKEIAKRLKIPIQTVNNWSAKGKWQLDRDVRLTRLENLAESRANDQNAAFLESVALQSEAIAEDALSMAAKHAKSPSPFAARNLQSSTQAVKNLVDVYFRARGIDQKTTGNATVNVQALFVSQAPIAREEKQVVELGRLQPPEVSK